MKYAFNKQIQRIVVPRFWGHKVGQTQKWRSWGQKK